jgi:hypothetical protein
MSFAQGSVQEAPAGAVSALDIRIRSLTWPMIEFAEFNSINLRKSHGHEPQKRRERARRNPSKLIKIWQLLRANWRREHHPAMAPTTGNRFSRQSPTPPEIKRRYGELRYGPFEFPTSSGNNHGQLPGAPKCAGDFAGLSS